MKSSEVRLDHLCKEYNRTLAVDDVSLTIEPGHMVALLGPSGCGKTTCLRMIAGLIRPTSGDVFVNDSKMTDVPVHRRNVGMLFQNYALFPHLTVEENIAFGLEMRGISKAEAAKKVAAALSLVQLSNFGKRYPAQLSGGQQQRVALARSLAKRPRLLLLDEPLGALDKKLREETQVELVNILGSVGVTCVMVTHDQEEAMTMASRIGVMSEGRLLQLGTPGEVYETPASRFVAHFIGNVNLMDGTVLIDEVDHVVVDCQDCQHYVGHGITGTAGMPVTVALRPEKILLSAERPEDTFNCVQGVIQELSYFGSYTVYRLRLPSGYRLAVCEANSVRHRAQNFAGGDAVWAHWQPSAQVVLTH